MNDKELERNKIEQATKNFLNRGGNIKKIEESESSSINNIKFYSADNFSFKNKKNKQSKYKNTFNSIKTWQNNLQSDNKKIEYKITHDQKENSSSDTNELKKIINKNLKIGLRQNSKEKRFLEIRHWLKNNTSVKEEKGPGIYLNPEEYQKLIRLLNNHSKQINEYLEIKNDKDSFIEKALQSHSNEVNKIEDNKKKSKKLSSKFVTDIVGHKLFESYQKGGEVKLDLNLNHKFFKKLNDIDLDDNQKKAVLDLISILLSIYAESISRLLSTESDNANFLIENLESDWFTKLSFALKDV